jgi:RNA polymerase sigma-70 factor (ECF subfamily)
MDPLRLTAWHSSYSERLRAFLFGVLRNHHACEEALQATFAKAVASGGEVPEQSAKAWLFQVAFNEAMALRRRWEVERKGLQHVQPQTQREAEAAEVGLVRWETVQRVRETIERLPPEQRQVVQLRMYEERTFQQIADQLAIPLGTVLTRMRLALKKLEQALASERQHD